MKNMNDGIKAFFIDLDGTTFDTKTKDGQHWISDINLDAIKKVRSEGKHVFISTGRLGVNVRKYFDLVGGDYLIAGNGAQIIDKKGKVLVEHKLTVQQVLKIFAILQNNNMVMKLDDGWEGYGAFTWFQRSMCQKFGFKPIPGYHFEMHKDRYKIVTWGKLTPGAVEKVRQQLLAEIEGIEAVTSAHGMTIEITHKSATKGIAARHISEFLLGIKASEAAHVGDSMNDSTVVGQIGRLIVMKNGHSELKKLSPYITAPAKKHGLAKALLGDYKKIEKKK